LKIKQKRKFHRNGSESMTSSNFPIRTTLHDSESDVIMSDRLPLLSYRRKRYDFIRFFSCQ